MTKTILYVGQPARKTCPFCSSPLPKRGHAVTDETGATKFVCRAHLAEFAEVAELLPARPPGLPSLDFDDFAFRPGVEPVKKGTAMSQPVVPLLANGAGSLYYALGDEQRRHADRLAVMFSYQMFRVTPDRLDATQARMVLGRIRSRFAA
jgi:hypothetical protein